MNGFGLLLIIAALALGWALHRRSLAEQREREEVRKELRLREMVAAIDEAGDDVEQHVFAQAIARGRWN